MLRVNEEKTLAKILSTGLAAIIVFMMSGNVTDPVNVTKLFVLGMVAFAAMGCLLQTFKSWFSTSSKSVLIAFTLFVLVSIFVLIKGEGPLSQSLYGAYGRNNGFLTYFCLSLVFLGSTLLRQSSSFIYLIYGLLTAGAVNIVYCFWVLAFGDPMSWVNPYNNILGTLGNPNFIGAFLGILAPALFCISLRSQSSRYLRILSLIAVPIALYEAYMSRAIQGRIVAIFGFAVIGFYYLRSKNLTMSWIYFAGVAGIGFLAAFGALQKGPLSELVYKTSVSLRGQYWLAAYNTGNANLWDGVGFDTFGDWYRRMRDIRALELPGPNITVNAAHNIPLDFFAFGGLPLLLSYLFLLTLVGLSILRVSRRNQKFDPIFVTLVLIWLGYQLQSLISINQIGLAVIGWIFGGAIIAYDQMGKGNESSLMQQSQIVGKRARKNTSTSVISLSMTAGVGAVVGALIAVPPLSADMKWRSAMVENSFEKLKETLEPSYLSPQNIMTYGTAIDSMERSGIHDYAHQYALEALKFNPDSFDLWRLLYLLRDSTEEEKREAMKNMTRLDPLNKDVLKL